jgi:hypothetical protein
MDSFEDFLRRREAASNDYIGGDPAALQAMLTKEDPATFLPLLSGPNAMAPCAFATG